MAYLSTHTPAAIYESFDPEEARRIYRWASTAGCRADAQPASASVSVIACGRT